MRYLAIGVAILLSIAVVLLYAACIVGSMQMTERSGGSMEDLISRQALCEYALNQKDKSITPNDIMRFPSAQPKKRTEERTETHACDLISRQAAIGAIVAQTIGYTADEIKAECDENIFNENGYLGGLKDAIEAIEDMPSAQPERRWIPCSERLPDELAEVNITWINTNPAPYYEFTKWKPNTGSAVYYKGRWYWYSAVCADYLAEYGFSPDDDMDDAIKVIAWMPLPEPYREEGD